MNSKRINWIDGLKGLSCIFVFLHHFLLGFYPASYYEVSHRRFYLEPGLESLLSYSPLGAFTQGNFAVNIFYLLSAFLLSRQIFLTIKNDESNLAKKAGTMIVKRYPRLMMPVLALSILNYFLLILMDKVNLNYLHAVNTYNFKDMLYHVLVLMWLEPDATVMGHFWMMSYLFIGSLVAILLAFAVAACGKWTPIVYLCAAFLFQAKAADYLPAVFGVLLAYTVEFTGLFDRLRKNKLQSILIATILILLGIYVGGYPCLIEPKVFYRFIPWDFARIHSVGALLLVAGLLVLNQEKGFLTSKPMKWLAAISYGVFLVHPYVISYVGYFTFDATYEKNGNYGICALITFAVCLIITLLLSYLLHISVEKGTEKLLKKI